MGKCMVKTAPSRGILAKFLMLIGKSFWSLIPVSRKRRKTPDQGTRFIKICVNEGAQTRIQDAGRTRGCKKTPHPAHQCQHKPLCPSPRGASCLPTAHAGTEQQPTATQPVSSQGKKPLFVLQVIGLSLSQDLAFRKCVIKEFVSSFLNWSISQQLCFLLCYNPSALTGTCCVVRSQP